MVHARHPSYAELYDGRLVTDNNALIAIERLPSGLSLGLRLREGRLRLPIVDGLEDDEIDQYVDLPLSTLPRNPALNRSSKKVNSATRA
jgi:hypothetical protein